MGICNRQVTLTNLIKALEDHDWHYEYSDDFSVWRKGVKERDDIVTMLKVLGPDGHAQLRKLAPEPGLIQQIEMLVRMRGERVLHEK